MELTAAAWFFTDNDEFFNGSKFELDPFYTADAHLIYNFRPGIWLATSAGYGIGAQSILNGTRLDNEQKSLGWGLTLGLPISRTTGVKLSYIGTRTRARTGPDTDTFTCGLSVMW
jgi:hypothetical protein